MSTNRSAETMMREQMLVKHYAGSIAYGTNLPTSDVDFRGIFCADPINIRTPFFDVGECKDTSEEDTVLYELGKFTKLALDCNPNVVETLWVEESDIVHTTEAYQILRDARRQLLSQKIAHTTCGYALSQLKRIKGHNKWINNPQPVNPPKQTDYLSLVFNFQEGQLFPRDFNITDFERHHRLIPYGQNIYGLYRAKNKSPFNSETMNLNTVYDDATDFHTREVKMTWRDFVAKIATGRTPSIRVCPIAVVKFNKDEYNQAKDNWQSYWNWKENRNEARSELEEHFGYDTKHAMHLVRLLRMGAEVLETGELLVKRPDAQELLEIRNGAWKYDDLVVYADDLHNTIKTDLLKKTDLPKKPNVKLAADLIMQVQDSVWS